LRWAGAFPVDRSGGRGGQALAVARAVVESGDGVVIFPEGKFHLDRPGLGPMRTGVVRLALGTGAPVIPVAAYGAKRSIAYGRSRRRPHVTAVWGSAMQWPREENPSRERIEQVRDELGAELSRLYAQAERLDAERRLPPADR
jgi:1-acyl-sn-glycerol-3-phosphate acyltransferase